MRVWHICYMLDLNRAPVIYVNETVVNEVVASRVWCG